jgi:hypothetical protein
MLLSHQAHTDRPRNILVGIAAQGEQNMSPGMYVSPSHFGIRILLPAHGVEGSPYLNPF